MSETYRVPTPSTEAPKPDEYDNQLRWWNTYYKKSHTFSGERVQVSTNVSVRSLLNNGPLICQCPYCSQSIRRSAVIVHQRQGNVACESCSKVFGVNPYGTIIWAFDSSMKEKSPVQVNKKEQWLEQECNNYGWELERVNGGFVVHIDDEANEFESFMQSHQMRFEKV